MKIKLASILSVALGLAFASFVTGCATGMSPVAQTKARIQEKTEAYNKLTPQQQGDILGGTIERGNTPDMVYMALGKPQKIVTSSNGRTTMWVYEEYFSANGASSTQLNNPGQRNVEGQTMVNHGGPNENSLTPGNNPSAFNFMTSSEMGMTGVAGPMQSLSLPDLATNTVYVFFYQGKVAEIKLDGDDATQISAHPAKPAKNGLNALPEHKV